MTDSIYILIIDDDQKIINSLKRILNKNEYVIYSATDPVKALNIIKSQKLDIIICDYNMPTMTGIELFKQSKNILPDAIRILLTGECDINITISAINEVGIFYYLTKPWKNEEIIDVIGKAVLEKIAHEEKVELYEILNDSKDYLLQTASMLNKASNIEQNKPHYSTSKDLSSNFNKNLKTFSVFPIIDDEDIILIRNTEIYYLCAADGNILIITDKGKYKSTDSLNAWEKKLGENDFLRCHRGYIVNIDKIEKISPWFNGAYNIKLKKLNDTIPVSRTYMKKLRDIFEI